MGVLEAGRRVDRRDSPFEQCAAFGALLTSHELLVVERDPASRGALLEVARDLPLAHAVVVYICGWQRHFLRERRPEGAEPPFNHGDGVRARAPRRREDDRGAGCFHDRGQALRALLVERRERRVGVELRGALRRRPRRGAAAEGREDAVDVEEDERLVCGLLRFLALWFLLLGH